MAANGGNRIQIYSPTPYQPGSSGSHMDDDTFTGGNQQLMNAASTSGPASRSARACAIRAAVSLQSASDKKSSDVCMLSIKKFLACCCERPIKQFAVLFQPV